MNQSPDGLTRSGPSYKMVKSRNQIEIPSNLDFLPGVDEFIEKKLKKLKMKKDQIADVAISVSEAVTNAVVHGNKSDISKKVKISIKTDSGGVEIIVEDEGRGFDPTSIASCLESENLLKHAGRGILILNSLMDKVEIICGPDHGTKVRMVKYIK
jgi:serine/threonine-protein kinase RsbW